MVLKYLVDFFKEKFTYTIDDCIKNLGNPKYEERNYKKLIEYGPIEKTIEPLLRSLSHPDCSDLAVKILKMYGPSDLTVHRMLGALRDPSIRKLIKEILLENCMFLSIGSLRTKIPNHSAFALTNSRQ